MADAAVEFLLENIRQLLGDNGEPIAEAKTQVEKLEMDLQLMRAFLSGVASLGNGGELQQVLIRNMRNLVYEAEDVIDDFVAQAFNRRSRNCCLGAFRRRQNLLHFTQQVKNVIAKIKHISSNHWTSFTMEEEDKEIKSVSISEVYMNGILSSVREGNVVGFEDEEEKLIGYLTEETEQLDVISIVGMPGIGKTTLAWKIYRDQYVQHEFPTRIWIHVGNRFTEKDICIAILRQIMITDDLIGKSSHGELARMVGSHLHRGKFLIVMDDVRSANDWERLEVVLPKSNNMVKILITSCNEEVAWRANAYRLPHRLRFLTSEESFELLELEVFGKTGGCPVELQMAGKLIARQCNGLPLAVVVMGGILSTKVSHTDNAWSKASEQVVPAFHYQNFYDELPSHLKVCFLYLAMFPLDFEIRASQLIKMWIAEGFIKYREGVTLEETGEHYLEDLISRNLVQADRIGFNGKVKTCRVHDMLHEFCRIQAGKEKENVLQEIKFRDGVFEHRISELPSYRRLCIHSNVVDFLSSKPSAPRVRSVVSFAEQIDLPVQYLADSTAFKLVRVLEYMPIRFSKFTSGIFQLVHLRYLTLSITLAILPMDFAKLMNLQTLIVATTSRTLEIKADIWNLPQFRHFKTNASANLYKARKTKSTSENLQTLGMISPQSCTEEIFSVVRNLKKLGIRGQLSVLFDGKKGSFDSLGRVVSLEKLKLINEVVEGQRRSCLPPAYRFPLKLRSLTLASTFLDWSEMSVLGLLENLEVLKLKDNAFAGRDWKTRDGGFRRLEALHVGPTDLTNWVTSAYHFPRLARLELHDCEKLREVPIEFADVPSLLQLDLYRTNRAADSAKKISEKRQEYLKGLNKKDRVFKLSIVSS